MHLSNGAAFTMKSFCSEPKNVKEENQTFENIASNTKIIEVLIFLKKHYIKELDKKLEYNVIDLESIFSWMNNSIII